MRNAILCLFLLTVSTATLWGQTEAYVTGMVLSADQETPLEGVDVFVQGTGTLTTTNRKGKYTLGPLAPGTYQLAAFAYGMQTARQSVTLKPGTTTLDFSLSPLEQTLDEVVLEAKNEGLNGITRLNSVEGTAIYEAKKTEVILIDDILANAATNNSRQVFAKVPGLNIWESDFGGLQLAIGGRGLDPNRTSNFNTRQNGYDISADALGYPESYYTPPIEALERIEVVRGAASLQYGTQFGGLLNFRLKSGPTDRRLEFTSRQSGGSFGLFSSFNSVGGQLGPVNYYGFYQFKRGDGWRPNSWFESQTAYGKAAWRVSEKLTLEADITHMQYLAQQPGGLTDALFYQDPTRSIRARNWFQVHWNVASVKAKYQWRPNTKLEYVGFGLLGSREALGILNNINRPDLGGERMYIRDEFTNVGQELRLIHYYHLGDQLSTLLVGTRMYRGHTLKQQGLGDAGDGPSFGFSSIGLDYSEYQLPSHNVAFFVENIFSITDKFSVTPGVRLEHIITEADGYFVQAFRDLAGNLLSVNTTELNPNKTRQIPLFGVGLSYKSDLNLEAYANFSQNYRAITFNDIVERNVNVVVDPNLRDERGYNADLGVRGTVGNFLQTDVSFFHLQYNDRIASYFDREQGAKNYRTNVGKAYVLGLESYAELHWTRLLSGLDDPQHGVTTFVNLALMHGEYTEAKIGGIAGNQLELVPAVNLSSGLSYGWKGLRSSLQYHYTSQQFTDASNAIQVGDATIGVIPSYHVWDWAISYQQKSWQVEGGINNLANASYFTRRATGYPGPGIIPATPRSFHLTLGVTF